MGGDVEARFGRRMGSRRGFRGVRSPRSWGGERPPHPSPWLCAPATWPPCTWGRGGGGRKPGRRGSRQRVGPSRLLFLRLDWLSGAAEPPAHSFIRSERGDGNPHSFVSSSLQLLIPSLHLSWRK